MNIMPSALLTEAFPEGFIQIRNTSFPGDLEETLRERASHFSHIPPPGLTSFLLINTPDCVIV